MFFQITFMIIKLIITWLQLSIIYYNKIQHYNDSNNIMLINAIHINILIIIILLYNLSNYKFIKKIYLSKGLMSYSLDFVNY